MVSNLFIEQLRRQATEHKNLKNIIDTKGKDPDDLLQNLSPKELKDFPNSWMMLENNRQPTKSSNKPGFQYDGRDDGILSFDKEKLLV